MKIPKPAVCWAAASHARWVVSPIRNDDLFIVQRTRSGGRQSWSTVHRPGGSRAREPTSADRHLLHILLSNTLSSVQE